jgi:hypothetical protein
MSRDTVSISLVSMECEGAIGDERNAVEMLKRAFKAAKGHWMVLEEEPQFAGALNAVLTKMGDEHPERPRLETEIRLLSQFNAWLRAAQMGVAGDPPSLPEGFEAFGIRKIWQEVA